MWNNQIVFAVSVISNLAFSNRLSLSPSCTVYRSSGRLPWCPCGFSSTLPCKPWSRFAECSTNTSWLLWHDERFTFGGSPFTRWIRSTWAFVITTSCSRARSIPSRSTRPFWIAWNILFLLLLQWRGLRSSTGFSIPFQRCTSWCRPVLLCCTSTLCLMWDLRMQRRLKCGVADFLARRLVPKLKIRNRGKVKIYT